MSAVPVIPSFSRKLPHVTRRIACCFCDNKQRKMLQREYDSGMSEVSSLSIMYRRDISLPEARLVVPVLFF